MLVIGYLCWEPLPVNNNLKWWIIWWLCISEIDWEYLWRNTHGCFFFPFSFFVTFGKCTAVKQEPVNTVSQVRETGDVKAKWARRPVHHPNLTSLRKRRLSSRDLQPRFAGRYGRRLLDQTIRNRQRTANPRAHKAFRKPKITPIHCQACLRWCRQHRQWYLNIWRKVMFSDESRFCLCMLDNRVNAWWRHGCWCYADCCLDGDGHFNAVIYQDVQPVATPYLHKT